MDDPARRRSIGARPGPLLVRDRPTNSPRESASMPRRMTRPRAELLEARTLLRAPFEAPSLGPPPAPGPAAIWVDTVAELQTAVRNAQSGQTIVVEPGTYD